MSGDNIIRFPGITLADMTPETILDGAKEWADPDKPVIVIAYEKGTGKISMSSTTAETDKVLAALTRAEHWIIHKVEGNE